MAGLSLIVSVGVFLSCVDGSKGVNDCRCLIDFCGYKCLKVSMASGISSGVR